MAERAEPSWSGLSVEAFRAFYQGRPDEERWELIDGVPMMMAPPTFVHQRIASNLERLLKMRLRRTIRLAPPTSAQGSISNGRPPSDSV